MMNKEYLIKNELIKTTGYQKDNNWSNNRTKYGYHSFIFEDINIIGQRNPQIRLDKMRKFIDFNKKTVIDIGCNTGGILFHLNEISYGIGYDFDKKTIKTANNIKKILNKNNLHFYVKDFDKERLMLDDKVDFIFLLSLGSWIKNWKFLYEDALKYTNNIILETNNDKEGESQLLFFRNNNLNIILISDKSDDDITGNTLRKTYLIYK